MTLQRKKNLFFTIKNRVFKVRKIKFFKRVNPCFWSKKVNFFVDVDLVKIILDIMLSDFPQEKKTFWTITNIIFQSRKNRIFFQRV